MFVFVIILVILDVILYVAYLQDKFRKLFRASFFFFIQYSFGYFEHVSNLFFYSNVPLVIEQRMHGLLSSNFSVKLCDNTLEDE